MGSRMTQKSFCFVDRYCDERCGLRRSLSVSSSRALLQRIALVRRRQLFTNIATYVALIACVHFTVNAACNFAGLLVVNGVHSRPA